MDKNLEQALHQRRHPVFGEYVKMCSVSFSIKEMQIKIMLEYTLQGIQCLFSTMAKIK